MLNRSRVLVLGLVVAVLGLVGSACWWWLFALPRGVNRDGFERIRVGMTLQDVEAILGGPSGHYGVQP